MNIKKLNWGVIITITWIVGIAYIWLFGKLNSPESLNELGDFLAGAFAPIAFLWLVLGYRQQGKQLEQNTKALEQQEKALQLQIEEMRESVKQQRQLVEIHNLELKNNYLSSKPSITCTVIDGEVFNKQIADGQFIYFNLKIILKNEGRAEAKSVAINSENGYLEFIRKLDIDKEYEKILIFKQHDFTIAKFNLYAHFSVQYSDIYQNEYSQHFEVKGTMIDDTDGNEKWEIIIVRHE